MGDLMACCAKLTRARPRFAACTAVPAAHKSRWAAAWRVALSWFTAEVDGQAKYLRVWLEERGVSYVMAIRRCDTFTTSVG